MALLLVVPSDRLAGTAGDAASVRERAWFASDSTPQIAVVDSRFRAGCPIVAVAVETNDEAPELARSAGAVFASWQEAFTALFQRHRLPDDRSRRLAALIVAAEEGAVILCRAEQSTAPMEAVAAEIHDLLVGALSNRPETGPRAVTGYP